MRRPTYSTLFPYTTLFRSREPDRQSAPAARRAGSSRPAAAECVCWNAPPPDNGSPVHWRHAELHLSFAVLSPRSLPRSEEHTSELQSHVNLVCRLLLEKKK